MSVPESKRGESRFSVIIKAESLARYTLTITSNERIFTREYQRSLTDDINNRAKNIYLNIWTANNIRVQTHYDLNRRSRIQIDAEENCTALLALIQLSHRVFHLKSSRVRYWGACVVETRNLIRTWRAGDLKRYAEIQ